MNNKMLYYYLYCIIKYIINLLQDRGKKLSCASLISQRKLFSIIIFQLIISKLRGK